MAEDYKIEGKGKVKMAMSLSGIRWRMFLCLLFSDEIVVESEVNKITLKDIPEGKIQKISFET